MKYLLVLSSSLLSLGSAYGQLRVAAGPQLALNAGTANYKALNHSYDTKFAWRGAAGGMVSVGQQHWAVQAAVQYAQKGFRLDDAYDNPGPGVRIARLHTRQTYQLNYLTLPINLAYSLGEDGQGWQVFAGGYASRLLGGTFKYDDEGTLQTNATTVPYRSEGEADIEAASQVPAPDPNKRPAAIYSQPWDFGAQAGVGYQWPRLLVQLSYGQGLKDQAPSGNDTSSNTAEGAAYKLRTLQLSAAYLLHLR